MKNLQFFLIGILVVTLICSGSSIGKKDSFTVIPMDLNSVKKIDIHSPKCIYKIALETKKESLLGNINNIFFKGDTLFIYSTGKLSAFNNKGRFLFNVGTKGRAANEYITLKSFFIKNGDLFLHDWDGRKLLRFGSRNVFIEKMDIRKEGWMPDHIFPFNDNLYVVKNTYGGEQTRVPLISVYDKNFNMLCSSSRIQKNGSSLVDLFFPYKNEVLYWEILCDTIYSINKSAAITPKYFVDFGNRRLPEKISGSDDLYTRIEYVNKPENKDRYATMVSNVREDEKYLYFSFVYGYGVINFARFDKKTGKTDLFRLVDSQTNKNVKYTYMTVLNGDIIVAALPDDDSGDNQVLYRIRL